MWIILLFLLVSLTIYWKRCNNDLFVHTSKLCVLRTDWWWSALPKPYYTTQNYFPYGWLMHFILIQELVSLHHKGSWFSDFPFLCRREIKFKEEEKRKVSQRYACSNFKLYSFVYIHLLILTYKYHCLYELWFMSCMRDSLFVTGNDFMMLAFFFF